MLRKRRIGKVALRIVIHCSERKSEKSGWKVSRFNLRRGERDRNFAENKNKYSETLINPNGNILTGAWLLADDEKQISDCTGGRNGDAVRYCQSEQNNTRKQD